MPTRQFRISSLFILRVQMSLLFVAGQKFWKSKKSFLKLVQFIPAPNVLFQMTGNQFKFVRQRTRAVRTGVLDDQDELEGRVALQIFRRFGNLLNRDVAVRSASHGCLQTGVVPQDFFFNLVAMMHNDKSLFFRIFDFPSFNNRFV